MGRNHMSTVVTAGFLRLATRVRAPHTELRLAHGATRPGLEESA